MKIISKVLDNPQLLLSNSSKMGNSPEFILDFMLIYHVRMTCGEQKNKMV